MVRMIWVAAVAAAAVMAISSPANAGRKLTPAEAADLRLEMTCGSAEVNSPTIIGIDARYDDQAGLLQKHYAEYRNKYFPIFERGIAKCADGKRKNAILAFYNSDMAAVRHFMDPGGDWATTMNLSNQQLARCITDYHATKKGAECETRLDENLRLKLKWQTAP